MAQKPPASFGARPPPPPSWLAFGPCDLRAGAEQTAEETAWAAHHYQLPGGDARMHAEAVVATAAAAYHHGCPPGVAAADLLARLEALGDEHPNALYVLGTANQRGRLGGTRARAGRAFQRGWDRHANVGCLLGLLALAESEGARAQLRARLVRFALQPDCLARALATGSATAMRDALWEAAEALRKDPGQYFEGARTGPMGEALGAHKEPLLRLYELGAGLRDAHAAIEAAYCLLGGRSLHGYCSDVTPCARGEAMCSRVLALPDCDAHPSVKSCALGLLGRSALERGDAPRARAHFDHALRVCEQAGGSALKGMDHIAVHSLTRMCFEAEGGPQDAARGAAALAHGVRLRFGPSLELAAEQAERRGDRVEAGELWRQAAECKMPRAMAIVQGTTLAEARERIAVGNPTTAHYEELAARLGAKIVYVEHRGHGIEGGVPGVFRGTDGEGGVQELALRCAACGAQGRAPPATAAELSRQPVAVLKQRLAALRAPTAGLLEKAELVACLQAAEAAAAAPHVPVVAACSQCRAVLYCNAACQKAHWREHKKVCKKGGE